jgi:hypothetical protein
MVAPLIVGAARVVGGNASKKGVEGVIKNEALRKNNLGSDVRRRNGRGRRVNNSLL